MSDPPERSDRPADGGGNADAGRRPANVDGRRADDGADGAGPRGRDVEVPMDVYKVVTVFSTLFAVAFVVGGFVLLDVATRRATAPLDEVSPWLALLGLGSIAAGAVVYAFSTRFRARGMGKPKDGADRGSDDG